jgi:hypothetical protein
MLSDLIPTVCRASGGSLRMGTWEVLDKCLSYNDMDVHAWKVAVFRRAAKSLCADTSDFSALKVIVW